MRVQTHSQTECVEAQLEMETVKGDESVYMIQSQCRVKGVDQDLPVLTLRRRRKEQIM